MISVIRWLFEKRLRAIEDEQGVSLAYMRQILRVSPPLFLKFMKILPLARFRRVLPPEVYHLARIVTVRHEACGSCLEMEARLAKRATVNAVVLNAVLEADPCALPPELAEAYFFAEALAKRSSEEDTYRAAVLRRYGEAGLVELSMAIAVCRVFPALKQAMGCAAPHVTSNGRFGALDG